MRHEKFLVVGESVAGTAFLFGASIYCGTFMLGTNFVYRLMFLLLCLPQVLDWARESAASAKFSGSNLVLIMSALSDERQCKRPHNVQFGPATPALGNLLQPYDNHFE